jgi:hypothetical protein
MSIGLNQFQYTEVKGDVKNKDKGTRFDCLVHADSATLVVGDCVKLVDIAGPVLQVTKITADTDEVFGMVQYESAKANSYAAGAMVTIAADYSIITCEASAAVTVGADLMPVISGQKVAVATAGKKIIGKCLQKGTTADLVKVKLLDKGLKSGAIVLPLALGTANQILKMNAGATAVEWAADATT